MATVIKPWVECNDKHDHLARMRTTSSWPVSKSVARGSREEVEALLVEHMPAIERAAIALSKGCLADAEDVVQTTCMRVIESWQQWSGPGGFSTWVNRIVCSVVRKTNELEFYRHGIDAEIEEPPDPEALSALELVLIRKDIALVWSKLSQDHRDVLFYAGVERYSYDEVAEILGLQKGTVMSRLNRARVAARKLSRQS